MTKPTKWHVLPAKTQISLGIRPVWSESLLSAWRKIGSLATHWVHSEDSDQTGWMPRLIWVFAGRTVILLVSSWGGSYLGSECRPRSDCSSRSCLIRLFTVCLSDCIFWMHRVKPHYRRNPKNLDIQKICCHHPKIWTTRLYHTVMLLKDADWIANSVDPDLRLHCLPRPICPKT